jgi:hypothetical protein
MNAFVVGRALQAWGPALAREVVPLINKRRLAKWIGVVPPLGIAAGPAVGLLVTGAVVGAAAGLLLSPVSGPELRSAVARSWLRLRRTASESGAVSAVSEVVSSAVGTEAPEGSGSVTYS